MKKQSTALPLVAVAIVSLAILIGNSCSLFADQENKGFLGSWRPVESDSDYLKQIDLYDHEGSLQMRLWNSVNGGEKSKSGEVIDLPVSLGTARNASAGTKPVKASRDAGFKISVYTLSLTEDALELRTSIKYTDDSGRRPREMVDHFVPGTYESGKSIEKPFVESGWLGNWRNIDDIGAGLAQVVISDVGKTSMSIWAFQGKKISSGSIASVVLPITPKVAESPSAEGDLKITKDFGFCKTTYKMTLKNDQLTIVQECDYVDPKRRDQTNEDHFKRGLMEK